MLDKNEIESPIIVSIPITVDYGRYSNNSPGKHVKILDINKMR